MFKSKRLVSLLCNVVVDAAENATGETGEKTIDHSLEPHVDGSPLTVALSQASQQIERFQQTTF